MLGVSVMANKGFAATEVKEVSEAALALCGRAETSSQAFRIQWLLFLFHYFRGQLRPAEEIARELVKLSETIGDPFFVFEAHRAAGANLLDQGHFNDALEHLEQVSALYDPKRRHESMTGQSPRVVAECVCARALWALGFPDAARQRVEGAVSLAEEFSRAESLVIASYFAAHLYQLRDEPAAARERAETVIGIAEEYGLPLWHAFGRMNRGWARMAQGEIAEGIDELRRGLAMSEATGATLWRPYYLGLLAQGLARLEHVDAAVAEITSALALVETTGEYWCAAELNRIQGELVIQQAAGHSAAFAQAEDCFRRSMAIAGKQNARSWLLRATMSLGRLYARQDKRTEGRRIVQDALSSFTEGHDTVDQVSAQAFLKTSNLPARSRS